jgi:5'-nucleotidase
MKILLTNDDGVNSSGLKTMAQYLGVKNEVFVLAPESQRSGYSHTMTFRRPLYFDKIEMEGAVTAYSFSGSPADCVRFAIEFFKFEPDLIISGPNIGPNLAHDVHYSGTVGAASEGALLGYNSIAVSCTVEHHNAAIAHFDTTCKYILDNLEILSSLNLNKTILNINVPNIRYDEIVGTKVVPYGKRFFEDVYVQSVHPDDGKIGYSLAGDFACFNEFEETDTYYICKNYVTVTPLLVDICNHSVMDKLKEEFGKCK